MGRRSRWLFVLFVTALTTGTALSDSITVTPLHRPFVHGRAPVLLNGLWGFIDPAGKVVVEPQFEDVRPFCPDGLAAVKRPDSDWAFIDPAGNEVVQVPSTDLESGGCFSEGLLAVSGRGCREGFFMDRQGRIAMQDFACVSEFSEGLAAVQIDPDGPWGYIDRNGALRIPPRFQDARPFSGGRAQVELGKLLGYIDTNGEMVVPAQFAYGESFAEGRAVVMHPPGWTHGVGLINGAGVFVTRERYRNLKGLSEGLAFFHAADGKTGYLDHLGNVVIDLAGAFGHSFSDGLAAVRAGAKWGFIDRKGDWVIAPQYDEADVFSEGMAAVRLGEEILYIDKKGQILWRSGPVEEALRSRALRAREEKRKVTAKPAPDLYRKHSTDALFRLLIRESRLDVLPELIMRIPAGSLMEEVHRRLPAVGPPRPVEWVLEEEESDDKRLSIRVEDLVKDGEGMLHLALRRSFLGAGPDYLGNEYLRHYALLYVTGRPGRWLRPVTITKDLFIDGAQLLLRHDGAVAVLFKGSNHGPSEVEGIRPGEQQLWYAEEAASSWTYRKILPAASKSIYGFDGCQTHDGSWHVAWASIESNGDDPQIRIAPLTTGHLNVASVIRRSGHRLTRPHWVECGTRLATVSQSSDGENTMLMLYDLRDGETLPGGRRTDRRWSNGSPLQEDIDLELAVSRSDRALVAAIEERGVIPFVLAPGIQRLAPVEIFIRARTARGDVPAIVEVGDAQPALLVNYEETALLIRAGPDGAQAAPLHLPGAGRLTLGPIVQEAGKVYLGFSRAQEKRVRAGVAEIDLRSLQWSDLTSVLVRATPSVSSPPSENFLILALWDQVRDLYESNHWPAAAEIISRLHGAGFASCAHDAILPEICSIHPDIAPCAGSSVD